jgi:hypothetical protein
MAQASRLWITCKKKRVTIASKKDRHAMAA